MLPQVAERRRGGEPGALEPGVGLAPEELDRQLDPETPAHPGHAAQRLADDQGRLGGIGLLRPAERQALVAAPAAVERLRLVAEVAQDGIVPAAPALHPPQELEEQGPLVLERGPVGDLAVAVALDEASPERHVSGPREEQPDRRPPVSPGPPDLLVVGLDRAGRRPGGPRPGRRAGRCPCRRRWWRRRPRPGPRRRPAGRRRAGAVEPGVIGGGRPAGRLEARALRLGLPPCRRVDDGGAAPRPGPAERLGEERVHLPGAAPPPSTSAARSARLGRAKPWTIWGVSAGRPSRARISSRTTGVAVAVQASTRGALSSARTAPSRGTRAGSRAPTR